MIIRSGYVRLLIFCLLFFPASVSLLAQDSSVIIDDSTFIYRSLSEALKNPERVFRLNLSRHKLDSFPMEVFQFKNLIELDLSRNKLEEIPVGLGQLSHLKKLDLANNKLVEVPDDIGQLSELVFLGLNRNLLVKLPPTIGGLQSLEVFELWDNELEDLPDEISQLQNLKILELRGILFTDEQQQRIDSLVVKSAKIYMSPSCNCKD